MLDQDILNLADFRVSADNDTAGNSDYPCELLKSGRSKFYKAFAAIRPILSKTALSHAWLWQNRLQRYHCHQDVLLLQPSLSFVSRHPESPPPPL